MNDMTERYIYAATKNLPRKIRADVEQELRGLIEDMLEARTNGLPPTESDVRVVLAELGTPAELAEKYSPDGGKVLIGPPYYTTYKMVLGIVLACVAFGVTMSQIIDIVLGQGPGGWLATLGQWWGVLFSALAGAFTFVTILFAALQRMGMPVSFASGNLNDLPPVPKEKEKLSMSESIAGIVFSVLFTVIFLAVPQIFGFMHSASGEFIPFMNAGYIQSHWWIILLLGLIGIGYHAFALYEGRYTMRLAWVNTFTNLLSAVLTVAFVFGGSFVNPAFITAFGNTMGGEGQFLTSLFANFHYAFLVIYLFAMVLDTGTTLYKAYRFAR